ncbi:hypothetical protein IQ238_25045 [Pleurocapsales cyanobacterium LEGE 06147]|nr:hypothetical protein [Pleurocapsales cyanobacterium LEGE 06147]
MNKELLTVLGCSSSLAITLLASNSAQANSSKEYVFRAPTNNSQQRDLVKSTRVEAEYPWYDCSCSEYNPEAIEKIDREGEKAISLYGCDCAGCRNLVRNLNENQNLIPQT